MIWNEGHLPENWTAEKLTQKHSSKPYNPDIANAFFRSGYIESWGRGTIKIIEKCLEAGLPSPLYTYEGSDFWVEFRKDIYHKEYLQTLDLNDRQLEALLFWKVNGEITNSKYMSKFDITVRTALRDITELVEKGLLVKTGDLKTTKYLYKG